MESSSEPILDVVRGLSTIASVGIMFTQVKNFYANLFRSRCQHCFGAGTVICRHCHGTKIRRTYPQQLESVDQQIFEHPNLKYECYHCGPYAMNDFDYDREGTDKEAWNMMDNLKAAMANRARPHKSKPVAGTVPCPVCKGQCMLIRHTPDFETFFGMNGTWMDKIRNKKWELRTDGTPPEVGVEIPVDEPPELPPVQKKLPNIRGLDGRSLDEVILPYVDDSDTTESSESEWSDDADVLYSKYESDDSGYSTE